MQGCINAWLFLFGVWPYTMIAAHVHCVVDRDGCLCTTGFLRWTSIFPRQRNLFKNTGIMLGKCKFQAGWLSHDSYNKWIALCTIDPHHRDNGRVGTQEPRASTVTQWRQQQEAQFSTILSQWCNNNAPTRAVSFQAMDLDGACKSYDMVTDAETLWTRDYSYRSLAQAADLLRRMFPDSQLTKAFSCGENKCSYITCHGLRPFLNQPCRARLETRTASSCFLMNLPTSFFSRNKWTYMWGAGILHTASQQDIFHQSSWDMQQPMIFRKSCEMLLNLCHLER